MKFMKRIASFAVAFAVAFGSSAYLPALSEKCAVPEIKASASCPREIMLDVCKAEVGYVSGYHKANKYTKWYGPIAGYADGGLGFPWCATFIAWCAAMAGCSDVICVTASCSYQWAHTSGTKHTSKDYIPQPGDLIYYGDFDHVGIVEWFDAENWIIHTIEGNYDQQVTRVERPYDSFVYGFITPEYEWQDPILPGHAVSTYAVPFSFSVDSYIHVYDRYGNYQDNHYTEPGDWCTIDEIYDNGYAHLIYPINGVDNGDYYCKLSDFERWIPNPRPSMNTPWITFDKASYTTGDTVNVSWTASPGDSDIEHYWVIVTAPSGEIANFDPCGTSYSFTAAESGTYTVRTFATPHNSEHGEGSLTDTKEITVNAPIPQGHEMTAGAGRTIPDGDYVIVSELWSNLYLDIPGMAVPAKPATYVEVCDGSVEMPGKNKMYDVWTVKYLNNGYYKISQYNTNICLDVENASVNMQANVQTCLDNGTAAQQWSIKPTDHGYVLQARCSSYCIDVYNAKAESGNRVWMFEENQSKAQSWGFVPVDNDERPIEDGEYYIKSALADYWLDAKGYSGTFGNGTNIGISDTKRTKFKVEYVANGYYRITEPESGLVVDLENGSVKTYLGAGNNIHLWTKGEDTRRNQLWRIRDEGNGRYTLISKLDGYCIDVAGAVADNTTNVQQYFYNYSDAQKWSFEKAVQPETGSESSKTPKVSYEVSGRQFRLKWNAITGTEKYGIAVYQSGKWKLMVQTAATSYTSPKISRGTYKIAVCAKIGNKWDTTNIKNRAFALTIQ